MGTDWGIVAKTAYKYPGAVKAAKFFWIVGLASLVTTVLVMKANPGPVAGPAIAFVLGFGFAAIGCLSGAIIGSIAIGISRLSRKWKGSANRG